MAEKRMFQDNGSIPETPPQITELDDDGQLPF